MKKIIFNLSAIIFLSLTILVVIMTTIGIETDKFNNIISKKINIVNKNINLTLRSIKFKLDVKDISLFLETTNPKINYQNLAIPAQNIKVYIDFISILKTEPKIKKINLSLNKLDISQLKTLSQTLKPSNLKSFISNKIKRGTIDAELEVYLNKKNFFDNFIVRGSVSNLETQIIKDINLKNTNFSFFADKTDILIKNITGVAGPVKISDGDLKLIISPEISLETNFRTRISYNNKFIEYKNLLKDFDYIKNLKDLEADLNNSFLISFDRTYKVKKYDYKNKGKLLKTVLEFKKPIFNNIYTKNINQISFSKSELKSNFNSKRKNIKMSGKYALNEGNFLPFNLSNSVQEDTLNLKFNADYDKFINFNLINYKKPENYIANISIDLNKKKDDLKIKKIRYVEGNNSILIDDIKFKKKTLLSFKKLFVNTVKDKKNNNNFSILFDKKIMISGSEFDASNLSKYLNKKTVKNKYSQISKDIEIDFKNITVPFSNNLKNFKLIGEIEKGKFIKISSKGDFGEGNFLDITMKTDSKSKKKYLEIYSDLTKPFLTEFNFFKGLTGGKLLYTSVIDEETNISKLKIDNFNVINAPGVVKLLSLADLSGLADLAEGEGLSFDSLEISMQKEKNTLKINEILALGPSISVLMQGYQSPEITSLRGTLIPAKTLNKMISKIPVLGDIIIPKEVGEGLFGISFKMKGPPGKIKTSINPIRTITPRFIQKIIDKNKNSK